jgi:hypothetical protein
MAFSRSPVLTEQAERHALYAEFEQLGIPAENLHALTNPALRQLLNSVKNALLSYRQSALEELQKN